MSRRTVFPRVLAGVAVVAGIAVAGTTIAVAAPAVTPTAAYIVTFASPAAKATEVADARARGLTVARVFDNAFPGAVVQLTAAQRDALAKKPGVVRVEADAPVRASDTQSTPPWGLDRIDQRSLPMDGAYSYATAPGAGVAAYVIETGVQATHADLAGRVAAGWSAFDGTANTADCNGHGTHVAGTLAGTTSGVAKAATVVPVRVLDCAGSGTLSGVIAGIDWAIGHHAAGVPAVANLSLGGGASTSLDTAVQSLTNDGVTVVAAAGNSATDACTTSPARAASAITVAATDTADAQASFSNFGSCVDVYAPGVSIRSAWYTSTTAVQTLSGTSMSAPHAAGVAAVLLGQQPTLTPAGVTSALLANATTNVVQRATAGTPNRLLYAAPPATAAPAPAPSPTPTAPAATAPAAPTAVTARALTGRAATVAWTQGANGGSALTKHTVKVFLGGKLVGSVATTGTATSVKVTGLTIGKSYTFRVNATNAVGTSPDSAASNAIKALR